MLWLIVHVIAYDVVQCRFWVYKLYVVWAMPLSRPQVSLHLGLQSRVDQANGSQKTHHNMFNHLEPPKRAIVFLVRTGCSSKWLEFCLGKCISSNWAFELA